MGFPLRPSCVYAMIIFSLMIPSETLLIRAFAEDAINELVCREGEILACVRRAENVGRFVIRSRFRKNLDGGCILRRPCLCAEAAPSTRRVFHPHRVWQSIAKRFTAWELLSPGFSPNNFRRSLMSKIAELRFPNAKLFATKAFRRGDTEELPPIGSFVRDG